MSVRRRNRTPLMTERVPRYMVLTAQSSAGGRKHAGMIMRVAVVETDGRRMPVRIDERLRCLVRVVKLWDDVSRYAPAQGGKFSQYAEACRQADLLVRQLNDPLTEFAMKTNPPEGLNLGPLPQRHDNEEIFDAQS